MHKRLWALLAGVWLAAMGGACDDDQQSPAPVYDASRVRRLFQPPEGEVRPVPPHAVHSQGVGPYLLGTSLRDILGLLPRGPRVVLMQIDGVLDYSLVRTEADTLLIGVEPLGGVTFLSVLDTEIARTESGVGVGTPVEALGKALGPELDQPERAMDPRLLAFARLPNTRFLLDEPGGRVMAVVVRQDDHQDDHQDDRGDAPATPVMRPAHGGGNKRGGEPAQARDGGASPPCPAGTAGEDELRAAAALADASADQPGPAEAALVRRGCFSTAAPEALVSAGGQVAVVGGEPGKLRRLAVHAAPGLVYAAPLDMDGDGRSEIVLVSQRVTEEERVMAVEVLRFEAGRLQRVVARDVYRISATNAAWVGARLEDLDLRLEVRGEPEAVQVTGLYVHRGQERPQTVAPLMKVTVPAPRTRRPGLGAPSLPEGEGATDAAIRAPADGARDAALDGRAAGTAETGADAAGR